MKKNTLTLLIKFKYLAILFCFSLNYIYRDYRGWGHKNSKGELLSPGLASHGIQPVPEIFSGKLPLDFNTGLPD